PRFRRELAGQDGQERRLAAAVGAEHTEPAPRPDQQVDAVAPSENRAAVERFDEAASDQKLLGLAARGDEVDPGRRGIARALALLDLLELVEQPVRLLDAGLGLGPPRLGAAAQPLHLAAGAVGEE